MPRALERLTPGGAFQAVCIYLDFETSEQGVLRIKVIEQLLQPIKEQVIALIAGKLNIKQDPVWIDQISRGEILRASYDQRMEIDPLNIRFLFAAIDEYDKTDRGYGQIPWRLGLLEPQ